MSSEVFARNRNGRRVDAHVHEPILTNEDAHERACRDAVSRAVDLGMDRAEAERMYGSRATPGRRP